MFISSIYKELMNIMFVFIVFYWFVIYLQFFVNKTFVAIHAFARVRIVRTVQLSPNYSYLIRATDELPDRVRPAPCALPKEKRERGPPRKP